MVQDIERMLRRLIGEQIDLRRHEATGLWPVKVDRTQIEQVILSWRSMRATPCPTRAS